MDNRTRPVPKQDNYDNGFPVVPPPDSMTVDETQRRGVYDAYGNLFTRRVGFARSTPDVTRMK